MDEQKSKTDKPKANNPNGNKILEEGHSLVSSSLTQDGTQNGNSIWSEGLRVLLAKVPRLNDDTQYHTAGSVCAEGLQSFGGLGRPSIRFTE